MIRESLTCFDLSVAGRCSGDSMILTDDSANVGTPDGSSLVASEFISRIRELAKIISKEGDGR